MSKKNQYDYKGSLHIYKKRPKIKWGEIFGNILFIGAVGIGLYHLLT